MNKQELARFWDKQLEDYEKNPETLTIETTEIKNVTLGRIAKVIGGEPAIVLYNLIDTFPDRAVLIDDKAWMKADKGAYIKLNMDSKKYYELINGLVGATLIDKAVTKAGTFYKINFELLDKFAPQENETPPEDTVEYEVVKE